jgi:hypothetical protein
MTGVSKLDTFTTPTGVPQPGLGATNNGYPQFNAVQLRPRLREVRRGSGPTGFSLSWAAAHPF